jgi:phosphoheptose isomerase
MTFPEQYRGKLLEAIDGIPLDKVEEAIRILARARDAGRSIFVCGNGGSASTASHFVCDMVKGASYGRPTRFRIMALTDSLPTITAYANDIGYDQVFVEQLRNFAASGDVLLAISGSGNSPMFSALSNTPTPSAAAPSASPAATAASSPPSPSSASTSPFPTWAASRKRTSPSAT